MKHTVVTLTGYDALGNEVQFGWTVASVTFQSEPVKIDFGGDWTTDGAGPATGYFAATGGFTGIRELRIKVEETDYTGSTVGLPFWLDGKTPLEPYSTNYLLMSETNTFCAKDFQYQSSC